MIIIKIIKVWSWKKIICSINGDAPFWRLRFDQVAISKKRIILYKWGLNPLHIICHIRNFLKLGVHYKNVQLVAYFDIIQWMLVCLMEIGQFVEKL